MQSFRKWKSGDWNTVGSTLTWLVIARYFLMELVQEPGTITQQQQLDRWKGQSDRDKPQNCSREIAAFSQLSSFCPCYKLGSRAPPTRQQVFNHCFSDG